ncbi:hypothetical protein ACF0H5_005546 [Mactra antiquata]
MTSDQFQSFWLRYTYTSAKKNESTAYNCLFPSVNCLLLFTKIFKKNNIYSREPEFCSRGCQTLVNICTVYIVEFYSVSCEDWRSLIISVTRGVIPLKGHCKVTPTA